jgi:hypothetical protein
MRPGGRKASQGAHPPKSSFVWRGLVVGLFGFVLGGFAGGIPNVGREAAVEGCSVTGGLVVDVVLPGVAALDARVAGLAQVGFQAVTEWG